MTKDKEYLSKLIAMDKIKITPIDNCDLEKANKVKELLQKDQWAQPIRDELNMLIDYVYFEVDEELLEQYDKVNSENLNEEQREKMIKELDYWDTDYESIGDVICLMVDGF